LISHNLPLVASPLDDDTINQLTWKIHKEVGDGMSLRYPDRLSYPCIPNDSYKEDTYRRVFAWAEELFKAIDECYTLSVN
jgi:hypothetical protein